MRTTSTTVKTEMPSSSLADSSSITIYGTNTSHPQFASSLLLINDGSSTTFGSEQPHCRMATNIENANDENSNNKEEEVDEQKEGEEMRSGEQPQQQQQRLRVSRKEKSLRIYLCPFRQRVEMEAAQGKDIHLETVARSMCVEKRRIYDIVNVMEALEMMEKTNKSFYKWHGDTHLPMLMHKLRRLAGGNSEKIGQEKGQEKAQDYKLYSSIQFIILASIFSYIQRVVFATNSFTHQFPSIAN